MFPRHATVNNPTDSLRTIRDTRCFQKVYDPFKRRNVTRHKANTEKLRSIPQQHLFEFLDITLCTVSAPAPIIRRRKATTTENMSPLPHRWIHVHSDGKIASINKYSAEPLNV